MAPTPLVPLSAAIVAAALLISAAPASASNWVPVLKTGSSGEAQAQAAPAAPGGVSAACVSSSGKTVTISWSAVAHAASYTVWEATSSSGPYTAAKQNLAATSWTTGTLTVGNYWFEVTDYLGSKWQSGYSAPTVEITIASTTPECKQP
jgi:hypothetical protein